jgi:hypothetical protein
MQPRQSDYFAAYRSLKLARDANGVLVIEFHSNGGPFIFTAQDHTQFVDAFYRISQDRENKIVILTGAGGEFIPEIDFSSFANVADAAVWSQVHDEGVQILENVVNIRVPVIAATEGRTHVHSEYAAFEKQSFQPSTNNNWSSQRVGDARAGEELYSHDLFRPAIRAIHSREQDQQGSTRVFSNINAGA